jgi:hypothetical protein
MADNAAIKFCLNCGADVSEMNKIYRVEVEVDPCGCAFCLQCLTEMEASRGQHALQCLIDQMIIVSHRHWKFTAKEEEWRVTHKCVSCNSDKIPQQLNGRPNLLLV